MNLENLIDKFLGRYFLVWLLGGWLFKLLNVIDTNAYIYLTIAFFVGGVGKIMADKFGKNNE